MIYEFTVDSDLKDLVSAAGFDYKTDDECNLILTVKDKDDSLCLIPDDNLCNHYLNPTFTEGLIYVNRIDE